MSWQAEYTAKLVSPEEAVSVVQSGHRVAMTLGQEPRLLCSALQARAGEIENVTIVAGAPANEKGWFDPGVRESFRVQVQNSYRYTYRDLVSSGQAEFLPQLFPFIFKGLEDGRPDARPYEVFMTVVSPPDEDGYCGFGHSLWNKRSYARWSKKVLVEVDQRQIRTCGTNKIHVSEIDYFVENTPEEPEPYYSLPEADEAVKEIGRHLKTLIKDGDTLQIGWSRVAMQFPSLGVFDDKKDLGLHSEVTAIGIPELVEAGVINGVRKTLNPGVAVVTSLAGAGRGMELAVNNPKIEVRDVEYTNDVRVIAAHDNMVAVNGAVMVDMTGQIDVETGPNLYAINGHGGQPEFFFGALMSRGGRSITVLRSTDKGERVSKIVPALEPGAAVTIPRTLADYVVTEYGIAGLMGKSLRERAGALAAITHPDFRQEILSALKNRFYSYN